MKYRIFYPVTIFIVVLCSWTFGSPAFAHLPLQEKHTVLSAAEYDYPPFSLTDEQGHATGFSVELLDAALGALGHQVSFRTGPWSEVKQALIDHKIHVLPLVGRTPEREAYFDFTFPYMTMHGTIIIRDNETSINNVTDLKNKEVAVLKGDNAEEFLRRDKVTAKIITTDSFEKALIDLSHGHYDAVVIQKLLATQLMRKNNLDNLRPVGKPLTQFKQSFCFAVPKGDSELLAILNEGLAIVTQDGTFHQLRHKWFAPLEVKKSRIIIGGDNQYPPYEYLDDNGQPAGFNVDLTRAIAKQLNLAVKIELDQWNQVRKGVQSGQVDLVQGMFYSTERDKTVNFSPAHSLVGHVIVTRKKQPHPESLDQLQGQSILVMQGDILHDLALKQGLEKQLVPVSSQEEALRLLASGQYDCALVARIPALYWAQKNGWNNLHVGKRSVVSPEYCYATLPENQTLLNDFSEALQTLKNSGEYRTIYNKWFGHYADAGVSLREISLYILLAIAPFGVLLILITVWNKGLKKKVEEKTAKLELEILQHKKTTEFLSEERKKFQTIFEHVVDYSLILKQTANDLVIVDLSESACLAHGYTREELIGKSINILDANKVDNSIAKSRLDDLEKNPTVTFEAEHKHKDGRIFPVEVVIRSLEIGGEPFIFAIERNITSRKKMQQEKVELENHIRQKYKMEAVGVLAGGIAHNFNNNLAIILGNLELAQLKSGPDESVHKYIKNAHIAVLRSRNLTQQILSYSRNQGAAKTFLVQPNLIIDETIKLMRATLPSAVDITYQSYVEDRLTTIAVNSNQLEEALINLCTNAVDAMDEKGTIAIELKSLYLHQSEFLPQYSCKNGPYVCISVADTGSGMNEAVMNRIFDPFFTTKEVDHGTGMGLATLQGFIKSCGGMVKVKSALGQGSTFELFFPLVGKLIAKENQKPDVQLPVSEDAHILLVDDEEMILDVTRRQLMDHGYRVTGVTSPKTALQNLQEPAGQYDLIISDQSMPELTGLEFIAKVRTFNADIPVILSTGYDKKASADKISELGISAVCLKPFEMNKLLSTISFSLSEK